MAHTRHFVTQVWRQGKRVKGHDSAVWRKDQCGAWIKYAEYGNRNSPFGWEVDRISTGEEYKLSNCRPMQWKNYIQKGEDHLVCSVKAKRFDGVERQNAED